MVASIICTRCKTNLVLNAEGNCRICGRAAKNKPKPLPYVKEKRHSPTR